jgi:hypothetical protein
MSGHFYIWLEKRDMKLRTSVYSGILLTNVPYLSVTTIHETEPRPILPKLGDISNLTVNILVQKHGILRLNSGK